MKKYVAIQVVNMIPTVDHRPITFLNQENRVCEDGVFTVNVVSTQAAVQEGKNLRDLRTGRFVSAKGKRISDVYAGTVFQFPDGVRRLVTRGLDHVVKLVDEFKLTPMMTVVQVI